MSNATTATAPATKRASVPAKPAKQRTTEPIPDDSNPESIEHRADALRCEVAVGWGKVQHGRTVAVHGPKEIRDPRLRDAILEHLAARKHSSDTYQRCQAEIAEAESRASEADDALQSLIVGLDGFVVHFRGAIWGTNYVYDADPALPCVTLIDER